ncbi:hypothetical protein KSS87_004852 [Heliosperma pusillum]|nr:hypothetical protein KSS87_004852 [Heliosperma pusillum]
MVALLVPACILGKIPRTTALCSPGRLTPMHSFQRGATLLSLVNRRKWQTYPVGNS